MKTKILFLLFFLSCFLSYSQSIVFNEMTITPNNSGINVNLKVTTFNGAGYLSNSYEVVGNTINLSVCYWFNNFLPVYQIETNLPIAVNNTQDYTINLSIYNSSSQTICDNFSGGFVTSSTYLNTNKNDFKYFKIYPNPFSSTIQIETQKQIETFELFDVLGKKLFETNSKYKLDAKTGKLNSGMYLLKIYFENGKSETIKIQKN